MAKVMINNSEFSEIQKHVDLAKEHITEAIDDIWATNFSNLYNNFITNGFLEALYKDAESSFNRLFGTGTLIIGGGGAIASGCAASAVASGVTLAGVASMIPVAGWIIGAIILGILAVIGIAYLVKSASSVQFKYDAKNVFEALLTECATGSQMNFLALENLETKDENIRLALQNVLFKIADFQTKYASLETAAAAAGVETKLAGDGTTLLGIQTEVTIDGQTIETTTSEAMNAFFTYSDTVMNAEIAGQYLHDTYGYDINFGDIVSNANAFMANTLRSGLYTHEFVDALLPSYTADSNAANQQISDATSLGLEEIKAMLANGQSIGGSAGLAGALLGGALLGTVSGGNGNNGGNGTDNGNGNNGNGNGNNGNGNGNGNNGNGNGGYYPGGGGAVTPTPGKDDETDKKPDEDEDTDNEEYTLEEMVEEEIPEEEVKPDFGEIDYDQLARDEYEFGTPVDEIIDHRNELLALFEKAYETGDLTDLEVSLKKYGFTDAEVDAILNDRFKCYKALLEGDERAILAEKAIALAAADGITDFDTHWDDTPNYSDLDSDGPSELLTLSSADDGIRQLKTDMDAARENYKTVVSETNELVQEANNNKAKVNELKAKFDKEFGEKDMSKWSDEAKEKYDKAIKEQEDSENKINELKEKYTNEFGDDTSKWSEEARKEYEKAIKENEDNAEKVAALREMYNDEFKADSKWSKEAVEEYNAAVKAYNESAGKVKEQLPKLEEAKTTYQESLDKFNTAKEEYYQKLKEESSSGEIGDAPQAVDENGDVIYDSSDGAEGDGQGTVDGSDGGTETIIQDDNSGMGYSDDGGEVRVSDNGIGFGV